MLRKINKGKPVIFNNETFLALSGNVHFTGLNDLQIHKSIFYRQFNIETACFKCFEIEETSYWTIGIGKLFHSLLA